MSRAFRFSRMSGSTQRKIDLLTNADAKVRRKMMNRNRRDRYER